MSFHIRDEVLSAYLDGEIEPARERSIDDHIASCKECRARLAALRGVVLELRRAPRLQPPPALAQQVRQQAVEQAPAGTLEALRALLAGLPFQPAMRTVMAMGFALVLSVSLFGRLGLILPSEERDKVRVEVREPNLTDVRWPTTSQVAGRQFVFNYDKQLWVQEGLQGSEPEARVVDAHSPEGLAVLTQLSELDLLLEDGGRVVVRTKNGTVELSPGRSPLRGASVAWSSAHA